ncbi:MAG: hypothetical protein ACNS61_15080 [Candidatus Wenzhouxiangella sp. M2_3B_020]
MSADATPHRRRGVIDRDRMAAKSRGRTFLDQVNRNLVALISLVLAITSLGYNTWRNETTEVQRNWRQASFRILVEIGEINQVILLRRYFTEPDDRAESAGELPLPRNWVRGWGKVTMVRDLSSVMPDPLPRRGQRLFEAWEEHADALDDDSRPQAQREAAEALLEAVEGVRQATIQLVADLS